MKPPTRLLCNHIGGFILRLVFCVFLLLLLFIFTVLLRVALFLFCFFLRDLRFLLGDHFSELGFALLSRFGVDVEFLALAVWQARIEAAFPEGIVYLIDASRTALTDLSRDRLGMWLCGFTRGVYGRVCVLLGCLLYLGLYRRFLGRFSRLPAVAWCR